MVSRELSISTATLERWRADALSKPARERAWTAPARFEAVLATAAMADPEDAARISDREKKADRRRIKELERDLRRKEKALAEAAALLVLSKKLEAIFPKDKDEDA